MPKQGQYKGQRFEGVDEISETTERRLDLLFDLYQQGIDIGADKEALLRTNGYIKVIGANSESYVEPKKYHGNKKVRFKKVVPVIKEKNKKYEKFQSIREEWLPNKADLRLPPIDFVRWIDSINQNFIHRTDYNKFDIYVRQAKKWLEEDINFGDFENEYQRIDYALNEFRRIQENSLYFLDKYGMFKGGSVEASFDNKYLSHDAQKILAYLFDCGFNLMIGKGRQIWFTTTMALLVIKRSNFHKNHFTKFICENLKKGQEILDDKIKYSFYHIPDWMKVSVNNEQEFLMKFVFKSPSTKGSVKGVDSKILVEAPYETAINGGSPDLILLDEIGQIKILGEIIQQGRPTLFGYDKIKGKQVPKRQCICYGTGGKVDKGGAEFEKEFNDTMKQWKERNFEYGIIPLYFDCFARPGFTREMYESEKAIAYASPDENKRIVFHQAYPAPGNYSDMFLSSKETLLPHAEINNHLQRIYDFKHDNPQLIQHGYFEPIYDTDKKLHESSFIPYMIRGVNFVRTDDDDRSPVTIYREPIPDWTDRYFQGTDPIDSASGMSNFSSSIWDSYENEVSACLNYRSTEYRNDYLQALLMNLYYNKPKHLIEINVGKELKNFIENMGYFQTLVMQTELPKHLQVNSGEIIGIKKVAANSPLIINCLTNLLTAYKSNVYIEDFFVQLKTFVRAESKSPSLSTGEIKASYRTDNYKFWKDDVIFAVTYAYICSMCFAHRMPQELKKDAVKTKKMRFVCNEKTGWQTVPMLI